LAGYSSALRRRVRKAIATRVGAVVIVLSAVAVTGDAQSGGADTNRPDTVHPLVTRVQYERWQTELSNWGRWGPDDELGTLNLITTAKRKQAAALVKEGISVSLSSDAPKEAAVDAPCPVEWSMVSVSAGASFDRVGYPCIHGAGITHIDSFAHVFFGGRMWNGYDAAKLVTKDKGAQKNSVLTMKQGIVTRGLLYDIAKLKGVKYLEPGTRIVVEDLEAWEKFAHVKAGPGDALLLRWGRWARRDALGPWPINEGMAGLDNSVIPWLKQRDIAVLGWETPDYAPHPTGDISNAVHNFALGILGIHILDRVDLDAVAVAAAARKRWEFMLTIAPLPIPNGTGSPVNPIAVF
jgi:kynurenine formamidase